jgi:hypothetical protein
MIRRYFHEQIPTLSLQWAAVKLGRFAPMKEADALSAHLRPRLPVAARSGAESGENRL